MGQTEGSSTLPDGAERIAWDIKTFNPSSWQGIPLPQYFVMLNDNHLEQSILSLSLQLADYVCII